VFRYLERHAFHLGHGSAMGTRPASIGRRRSDRRRTPSPRLARRMVCLLKLVRFGSVLIKRRLRQHLPQGSAYLAFILTVDQRRERRSHIFRLLPASLRFFPNQMKAGGSNRIAFEQLWVSALQGVSSSARLLDSGCRMYCEKAISNGWLLPPKRTPLLPASLNYEGSQAPF
jgi:hypothetical protein